MLLSLLTACTLSDPSLTVFVASSTARPTEQALQDYTARHPVAVRTSSGASSTLAHQIQAGAGADLFLSANPQWAQAVHGLESVDLLSNSLVVVSTTGTPDLHALSSASCVALGDPAHVPAGQYAQQALEAAGLWSALADRVVPTLDGPAAALAVSTGACEAGVVYATDAKGLGLPMSEPLPGPTVRYPLVLLTERGRPLYEALRAHRAPYLAAGFTTP